MLYSPAPDLPGCSARLYHWQYLWCCPVKRWWANGMGSLLAASEMVPVMMPFCGDGTQPRQQADYEEGITHGVGTGSVLFCSKSRTNAGFFSLCCRITLDQASIFFLFRSIGLVLGFFQQVPVIGGRLAVPRHAFHCSQRPLTAYIRSRRPLSVRPTFSPSPVLFLVQIMVYVKLCGRFPGSERCIFLAKGFL